MTKRKSLGRGLDALLSVSRSGDAGRSGDTRPPPSDLRELPVDLLQRGQYQPRIDMHEDTLAELAESIKVQGVVQPIVVRPVITAGAEQRFEIVAGERRWRAAQLAGLDTVPAIVRDIPDEAAVAVALIENIQRENLNPIEEARSLAKLVQQFEMTHGEAAEAVGRSRAAVSNLLRLLELPPEVMLLLESRQLDMGHARALLGVTAPGRLVELGRQAAREGWSVRETERAVQRLAAGKAARRREEPAKDPNVRRLETDLGERLGTSVAIETSQKGGRIVIKYHSLDELDGILARIK
jgi:ParB family transcriptional regulator, chromosome partitioning protein